MLMVRSGRRSGSWEVMQMREVSFPVELVRGVPVVGAPEEIDITNAAGLRTALLKAAGHDAGGLEAGGDEAGGSEAGGHRTFVVDMTRTRFCDSAGIAALVGAHKRAQAEGGRVLLAVSGAAVPRIFELTGIDRIIPSFTSLEEALAETLAGTGPLPLADLAEHAAVDGDQGRLLFLAEALVGADRILGRPGRLRAGARFRDPDCRVGRDLVDEAGLGHQRLRGNVERVGDLLEYAHRGLVQAALDLAEVRVRQVGQFRQLT
jgi:anti-sigma B factor antagonist